MAKTHPSYTIDTTFTAKDIRTALSVYAFTAAASAKVQFIVKLTNAAGGGDYVVYLTHGWLGAADPGIVLPKTTATAAAGELILEFVTMEVNVKDTDVVNVMVKGLAGDTAVVGAVRVVADNPSVFEAADPVTLANAAHGGSAATLELKSIVVSNTSNAGVAVTLRGGNPMSAGYPVNLLGSAGNSGGGTIYGGINTVSSGVNIGTEGISGTAFDDSALHAIRDSMKLAPTAGDPAAGSVDKRLDDILEDTGTTLPALISAGGSGSGLYSEVITIKDPLDNPLDGVLVQVATDSTFANIIRSGYTNNLGQVTLNFDALGTYYGRAEIGGYGVSEFNVEVTA